MEIKKLSVESAEVTVGESLDISNSNELKQELRALISQGIKYIQLNFQKTKQLDSSGLGKILYFAEILKKQGGRVELIKVQDLELQSLFEIIQLQQVITIKHS